MPTEIRSENVVIRYSPTERRAMERAARAAGARSLSNWTRGLTLREVARLARLHQPRDVTPELARARELGAGMAVVTTLREQLVAG
jgi:hypothetical protein